MRLAGFSRKCQETSHEHHSLSPHTIPLSPLTICGEKNARGEKKEQVREEGGNEGEDRM